MGTNVLKDAADKLKNTGIVIPLTMLFVVMFIISCALMVEDYATSRFGYALLPTQKANDWVIPLVALLPQVGQVGFGYVFATDTNKRWSLLIAVLLWVVDVATDVFFKAYGMNLVVYGIATAESIIIYSLGSEVMLATSVGMLILLAPSFFRQTGKLAESLLGGGGANRKKVQQSAAVRSPQYGSKYPVQKSTSGPSYRPATNLYKQDEP